MTLKEMREAAEKLEKVSKMRWGEQMRALAELAKSSDKGKKVSADYFFEFYCFVNAALHVKSLSDASTWTQEGPDAKVLKWPLKPGNASNFSCFKFKYKAAEFRLHPGVEANPHTFKGSYAPDISIRRSVKGKVRMITMWDAKFRTDPNSPLTRPEVLTFVSERELLVNPLSTDRALIAALESSPMTAFRYCGLLTNGKFSNEDEDYLREKRVQEVARFATPQQEEKPIK